MKLKNIKIKGWRSFDTENGIEIKDIRRINLFIGKNNAGKSNISRYFYYLKNISDSLEPNDYAGFNNITDKLNERDTWAFKKENIETILVFNNSVANSSSDASLRQSHGSIQKVSLSASHFFSEQKLTLSLIHESGKTHLENLPTSKPKVLNINTGEYENYKESSHLNAIDTISFWNTFLESLVFIDPIRHHSRPGKNDKTYYFEGSKLIEQLNLIDQDDVRAMRKFRTKIQSWLKVLLGEEIDFNLNNKLQILVKRDNEEIEESLDTLGTGVSQLFMVLSYLYWNKDKQLNIFLEEPENNIHPDALIGLIRILESEFSNHTYFISTHSASLIDQANDQWSIHHISRKPEQSSNATRCGEVIEHFQLLEDLGYRASQLIQSNLVIWVEGPSDRIYINKWIKLLSNNQLFEHRHYSFLMYGGSNLASYDLFENEENISMLKMSRYAVIVCDSDKRHVGDKVKPRVQKIYDQLKPTDSQTNTSINSSCKISDYVFLWISNGKEIENYVPNEIFIKVISDDSIKKHRFNLTDGKDSIQLDFDIQQAENNPIEEYSIFTDHFASFYTITNGDQLSPQQVNNIKSHLNSKKVELSKKIANIWEVNHFTPQLKDVITSIIQLIKVANNLPES